MLLQWSKEGPSSTDFSAQWDRGQEFREFFRNLARGIIGRHFPPYFAMVFPRNHNDESTKQVWPDNLLTS
jgi:hypothetical protein